MNEQMTATEEPIIPYPKIAGFWRRALAVLVDGTFFLILAAVIVNLVTIGLIDMVRMGNQVWAGFVGAGVVYYSLLNSRLSSGQTVGKKALRIKVVGTDFEEIGVFRSFLRYIALNLHFFILIPLYTQGDEFNYTVESMAPMLVASIYGGTLLYLAVFNSRNRRTLHDYIAGTYVVMADEKSAEEVPGTWRGHWAIACAVQMVFVGWVYGIYSMAAGAGLIPTSDREAARRIAQLDGIASATVLRWETLEGSAPAISVQVDDPRHLSLARAFEVAGAISPGGLAVFDEGEYTIVMSYNANPFVWDGSNQRAYTVSPQAAYAMEYVLNKRTPD